MYSIKVYQCTTLHIYSIHISKTVRRSDALSAKLFTTVDHNSYGCSNSEIYYKANRMQLTRGDTGNGGRASARLGRSAHPAAQRESVRERGRGAPHSTVSLATAERDQSAAAPGSEGTLRHTHPTQRQETKASDGGRSTHV